MHQVQVRNIAVRENHRVHVQATNQFLQLVLGENGYAIRIACSRQRRGIAAARDARNLGGCEADYFELRLVPEDYVEVMEVPARSA